MHFLFASAGAFCPRPRSMVAFTLLLKREQRLVLGEEGVRGGAGLWRLEVPERGRGVWNQRPDHRWPPTCHLPRLRVAAQLLTCRLSPSLVSKRTQGSVSPSFIHLKFLLPAPAAPPALCRLVGVGSSGTLASPRAQAPRFLAPAALHRRALPSDGSSPWSSAVLVTPPQLLRLSRPPSLC